MCIVETKVRDSYIERVAANCYYNWNVVQCSSNNGFNAMIFQKNSNVILVWLFKPFSISSDPSSFERTGIVQPLLSFPKSTIFRQGFLFNKIISTFWPIDSRKLCLVSSRVTNLCL